MSDGTWLSKSEVNSLYYNTVAGEIVFATEAQWGHHPAAVARLVAGHAAALGKREIRIVELGANNCSFAQALLDELRRLRRDGATELERVDYLAVELARGTLEAVATQWEEVGLAVRRGPPTPLTNEPPARPAIVAFLTGESPLRVNLGLVHSEANQFARSSAERFDFALLNELLDDMPYRAFYADAAGARFEAVAGVRGEADGWRLRVQPEPLDGGSSAPELPPGTLAASSRECVELVTGVADLLSPGGMMLVHDYGFAEEFAPLALYAEPQPSLPAFVTTELPPGEAPRSFFRVFANESWKVVQVTNDVGFAELAAALAGRGTTLTLAHGGMIATSGKVFAKGDGVFLSEFTLLEPGDDLDALLARLHAEQARLRDDYFREYMAGRGNGFLDLIFVKERAPTGT